VTDKFYEAERKLEAMVERCDTCDRMYVKGKTHRCEYHAEPVERVEATLTDADWNLLTQINDNLRKNPLNVRTRTEMRDDDVHSLDIGHRE